MSQFKSDDMKAPCSAFRAILRGELQAKTRRIGENRDQFGINKSSLPLGEVDIPKYDEAIGKLAYLASRIHADPQKIIPKEIFTPTSLEIGFAIKVMEIIYGSNGSAGLKSLEACQSARLVDVIGFNISLLDINKQAALPEVNVSKNYKKVVKMLEESKKQDLNLASNITFKHDDKSITDNNTDPLGTMAVMAELHIKWRGFNECCAKEAQEKKEVMALLAKIQGTTEEDEKDKAAYKKRIKKI